MGSNYGDLDYTTDQLPQHKVTITQGFWLGRTTVTQEQWKRVMNENPSRFKGKGLPVEEVSWFDCQAFLNNLSQNNLITYRLPSEAEWEYACRAGSAEPSKEEIDSIAWYYANCNETQLVARKKPNAWGLYDMLGNVKQWCTDWRGPYSATPATDPQGPANGKYKIIRGGSWYSKSYTLHSYSRWYFTPDFKVDEVGIRIVMVNP
jgi:formylglycine-generating enzyme required for sulfatase activity